MSSVTLTSMRQISEATAQNDFIWVYWENDKWIPFIDSLSSTIEKAFRDGFQEILINGLYRIDLRYSLLQRVHNRNSKQPIRRCRRSLKSPITSDRLDDDESRRCERFSFPLGLVSYCSATVDTDYYGSPFIEKWFLTFTKGKRNVTFDSIFPVLVQGIQEEGKTEKEQVIKGIVSNLNKIKDEVLKKSEKTKMETLENYCATLYTKPCFIYRIVNIALRDSDYTKLRTLGPFCFLVFNYIGRHFDDERSIQHRLQKAFRPIRSRLLTVYRGDYISDEMLEMYQQAMEDKSKYFKWLSFVSTSRDRDIAEDFVQNVLYIINMQDYSLRDQFVDISTISICQVEKEVLLQPGVRFQVDKLEHDEMKSSHIVHISIVPSYVSSLR